VQHYIVELINIRVSAATAILSHVIYLKF